MAYRIDNTLLPTGFLYKILCETLNMVNAGQDITDSPYVQWGRKVLKNGAW